MSCAVVPDSANARRLNAIISIACSEIFRSVRYCVSLGFINAHRFLASE